MKEKRDYIQDIAEIRAMMERSTKFLSLSGWAGVMAGIYALSGAWIANRFFDFNPDEIYSPISSGSLQNLVSLGVGILVLAVGTAIFLSWKKADKRDEKLWNATSRRLLVNMVVPLFAGGILILVLLSEGLTGLVAPMSLLFYGLALYNASRLTYDDLKFLGLTQMGLGLLGSYFIELGLLFWAIGFGVVHIIYGIYLHLRYER